MKTLKVVLIALVVIVASLVVALFIFLKTVDLNRYLPPITEQVTKATGREIKIGNAGLDFSFFRGVSLDLKDIVMSDDTQFSDKPFLNVGRLTLGVDLGAILGGKIVVTEIAVEALRLNIIHDKDGRINVASIGAVTGKGGTPSKSGTSPSSAVALPVLLVKNFHVDGAGVSYVDQMFAPTLAVPVNKIDILVKNFSLTDFFDVSLKASAFSSEQDIVINGRVGLDPATLGAKIEEMKVDMDLGKVAMDSLTTALPMLAPAGLQEMKGVLSLNIGNTLLNPAGLKSLRASASMANGRVVVKAFPVPVEKISLSVDGDEQELSIKDLSCSISSGTIHAQGTVKNYLVKPVVTISGTAQGIEARGISDAYKLPVKANGKVTGEFQAGFSGMTPQEIVGSLDGELKASMKDGSLEGLNLLQAGLANIPMLPGLLTSVQSSLPPETQSDLQKGITLINSCETVAKSKGGVVTLEKAELVTRDVTVSATGTANLLGDADIKADLYIEKALAQALISKVKDLVGISTDDGRLYIPFSVQGPLMKPKVQPDVAYLSKKLLMERGKDQLQKVLEKNPQAQGLLNAIFGGSSQEGGTQNQPSSQGTTEGGQTQPAGQGAQPDQGGTSTNKAVNALFNAIFEKK